MSLSPCECIHNILSAVLRLELADTTSVPAVWGKLAVEYEGVEEAESLILQLSSYSAFAREMITQSVMIEDDRKQYFLRKIANADRSWSVLGGATNFSQLKGLINKADIDDLLIVDEFLKASKPDIPDYSILQNIRGEASSFSQKIAGSDADLEVKAVVVGLLNSIVSSIDYYQIHGSVGVVRAITRAKAELANYEKQVKAISKDGDHLGQSLRDFVDGLYAKARGGEAAINLVAAYMQTAPALIGFSDI